jgi:hypothetical protein
MYFADFNNFVAFGEFASIDIRVKIRRMISGSVVKTFSVNTKIAEYTLQSGMYYEVCEALDKCIADLVELLRSEGFTFLADALKSRYEDGPARYGSGSAETMAYAIGSLLSLNHNWDTGSSLSWTDGDKFE